MPAPASHIDDITWAMLTTAGIDIDKVNRQHGMDVNEAPGDVEYVYRDATTKIAFGPAFDPETRNVADSHGWDIAVYDLTDGEWQQATQDWVETAEAAVAFVARYAARVRAPEGPDQS